MSDDSSESYRPTPTALRCDRCRERPAVGYTEGYVYPDTVAVYCRECGEDKRGFTLFRPGVRNSGEV